MTSQSNTELSIDRDSAGRTGLRTVPLPALVALVPLVAGCASGSQTRAGLAQSAPGVTMTTQELRIRATLYANQFGALVELTADSIIDLSPDPEIDHRALMWKANAIPSLQEGVLISDPLAAMIDGWTFAVQMEQFFSSGAGSEVFGQWQPMAVRTSRQLVNDAAAIARLASTDSAYANGERFVTDWARDHRIESLLFGRVHTSSAWAKQLGVGARGGLAAAADINESITVISNRMSMYAASLPKQARWQAELLLWDIFRGRETQDFLTNMSSITSDMGSVEEEVRDIRDVFVDVQQILDNTVQRAFDEMDEQMATMLDEALQDQGALSAMIAVQRQAIFDEIARQRVATMEELDSIVQHAVRVATADSKDVIDHIFLRTIQLLAGLIVLGAIAGLVFARARRRT